MLCPSPSRTSVPAEVGAGGGLGGGHGGGHVPAGWRRPGDAAEAVSLPGSPRGPSLPSRRWTPGLRVPGGPLSGARCSLSCGHPAPLCHAHPGLRLGDRVGRACGRSSRGSVLLPLQGSTGWGGQPGPRTLHAAITPAPGLHGAAGSWHVGLAVGSAVTLGLPPGLLQLAQACALRVLWGMPRVHRHLPSQKWPCLSLAERPGGRRGECRCPGTPPAPLPPSWCRTGSPGRCPGASARLV